MSYSKFLVRNIVVPAGGWSIVIGYGGPQVATVPAGTYDDVLHIGQQLEDSINALALGATWTVGIDQVGICRISATDTWTIAGWDSELSALLGYDETEIVVSRVLTATYQHTHGWYPGVLTHNRHLFRGAGRTGDTMWVPVDSAVRAWSGARVQRTLALAEKLVRRTLMFDLVSREEVRDLERGVAALWHEHIASPLAWYLDRSVGDCGSYGTQGDPATHTDATADWWLVDMVEQPKAEAEPTNPALFTVTMVLNGRGT